MRKTLVISGSRADKGPLFPVAQILNSNWLSVDPIESNDGHQSSLGCANALNATAAHIKAIEPNMVIVLGDRYEILGAATAAYLMGVPIAHLSGGDVTLGSQDNSIRDAITKLSHIHFATCQQSADRIVSMGEDPWRVFTVGCPGIDHLLAQELLSKEETLLRLGISAPYFLVSYQSPTLAKNPLAEADELIKALEGLHLPCVFTTLNPDTYSKDIEKKFSRFCLSGRGVIMNMPSQLYLSAMKHCEVMIGNSSSGFYEAPTLKVPFVNIGDRQKGRLTTYSVVDSEPNVFDIRTSVRIARTFDRSIAVNPYGNGYAAVVIKNILEKLPTDKHVLLMKGVSWATTQFGEKYIKKETGVNTPKKNLSDGQNEHSQTVLERS